MEILSSRIILRPRNYRRTLGFYIHSLGLAVAREYPGGTVLFAGQGLIEVAAHAGTGAVQVFTGAPAFTGALWLQVRDVDAAGRQLERRGVRIDREARTEPWGLRELWISDPDGVKIVLVEVPDDHPLRRDNRLAPEP